MKNEEYNDIFNDGNKPVDYKTIIFEYLLYWPVIAVCLILSIAHAPRLCRRRQIFNLGNGLFRLFFLEPFRVFGLFALHFPAQIARCSMLAFENIEKFFSANVADRRNFYCTAFFASLVRFAIGFL